MIIIDPEDSKPQQVQVVVDSEFGSVQPQSHPVPGAPSSYTPSYHITPLLPPPPPPSYPRYPSPHHPTPPTPAASLYRQSPAKRFWKAFAVALVIYLALVSLARTLVHMASGIRSNDNSVGAPRPEDGRVLESVGDLNWGSYHDRPHWAPGFAHSAEASFVLPVASNELYLISRGSYQGGKVQVKQSAEQGDIVRVDVRVAYHDQRALARAAVCRLHKGGNRDGVGIFTPTPGWSSPSRDRLLFEVVFTFPAAVSAEAPLRINEFTIFTSNFVHEIGDLWQSMLFESIELSTSNSPIRVDSITLTKGTLTSSNGPIVGHFNASDALSLHTSNAHIQATASLFSAGRDPTKLDMRTSNGPIASSISLTTQSGTGGHFIVKTRSNNGGVKVHYDDAPSGVRLDSEVRTSNGPAEVVMHPMYEGVYEVGTSNGRPVVRDVQPVDPTGAGRRRVVDRTTSRDMIFGRVYWVGEGVRGEGSCTVHTSNSRVSLDL